MTTPSAPGLKLFPTSSRLPPISPPSASAAVFSGHVTRLGGPGTMETAEVLLEGPPNRKARQARLPGNRGHP